MRVENLIQSKILCTKYLTVENNRLYGTCNLLWLYNGLQLHFVSSENNSETTWDD